MRKLVIITLVSALFWSAATVDADLTTGVRVASPGGVTNVKEVVNRTPGNIWVGKLESDLRTGIRIEDTEIIPPNGVWTGEMWVPWADNADQFDTRRMFISPGTTAKAGDPFVRHKGGVYAVWYWIWQSGEYLRFSDRTKFIPNAPRVLGEASAGGDRRLVVAMKGDRVVFAFEKLER